MNVVRQARSSCCHDRAIRSANSPRTLLVNPRKTHAATVVARPRALRAISAVAESAPSAQPVSDKPSEPVVITGEQIKVARDSDVKVVAGKIAHTVRKNGDDAPTVVCIGPNCTYTGIKAIIIARQYLAAEKLDLSFQPAIATVGQDGSGKPLTAVAFKLTRSSTDGQTELPEAAAPAPAGEGVEAVEMHIPSKGKHWLSAASLVKRVEERRPVCLTAIGRPAGFQAALTLEKARKYLAKEGKDLRVVPSFVKVPSKAKDKEVAALRFDVEVVDA